MHAVYVACLVGGFVATVLFAALGALGGAGGHGAGHLQTGHGSVGATHHIGATPAHTATGHGPAGPSAHGPIAAHQSLGSHDITVHASTAPNWLAAAAGWTLSWLSPLSLAAAALLFGGVGLVSEMLLPGGVLGFAVVLAVLAGFLGAALVRALMSAFMRASTAPLQSDAIGAVGTINAAIRADAPGEVIYMLEGLRRSAAARSVEGLPLPRGTNVVIVRRERGIVWVSPLDPLAALDYDGSGPSLDKADSPAHGGDLSPPL